MDFARLKHMPAIKLVMTPFPHSVEIGDPISVAEHAMAEQGLRHLPVSEKGQLVGIVTDRDIASHVNSALPEEDRDRIPIGQICTREVYVVDASEPLDEVLIHLADHHVGSVLIVKQVGDRQKLVGIFTLSDVCSLLLRLLRDQFDGGEDEVA